MISNLPAVNAEDVNSNLQSSANLLAPEEVMARNQLVADEEKTKAERIRDRRKKKTKQRVSFCRWNCACSCFALLQVLVCNLQT